MRLLILAVGRMKSGPERELVDRYVTRARQSGRSLGLSGCEVIEVPESRASAASRRKIEEADAIRAKLPEGAVSIALDERDSRTDSRNLAAILERERDIGRSALAFLIGGADGLDPSLLEGRTLSFGALVIPHQLVRILVAEQLYRATTILAGHPYHRD